ncbi:MAG: AI-2E family transporter [Holosporaceae bacterium]|jgi:predicted PurR-regulated permease PerM|nr:AI-2E family transporter [Holosporaceae bacterium]
MPYVKINDRYIFWIAVLFLGIVFFYLFSDICFPFIAGFVMAYLCAPILDRLSAYGVHRGIMSFVLTIGIVAIFVFALVRITPVIKEYLVFLSNHSSDYYARLVEFFNDSFSSLGEQYRNEIIQIKNEMQHYLDKKVYILLSIIEKIASQGDSIRSLITFSVVTPIAFFYFLKDWDGMSNYIVRVIPHRHKNLALEVFELIRRTLRDFFNGQFYVIIVLSTYYGILLTVINPKNAFSFGIISGLFSFIPVIGAMFSCILVIFLSAPILTLEKLLWIASIYFVGQFIESYFLYPRFVGRKTGLHPLWILFAFFAGALLHGIIGVLVSIPIAAVLRNLVGFAVDRFRATMAYKQQ